MKPQGTSRIFLLMIFLFVINLACGMASGVDTRPTPIQPAQQKPTQPNKPEPTQALQQPSNNSGGLVTFTDRNELYQIQLPGDWNHTESSGDNYYIDTFNSPDEQAMAENIVYDDGTTFDGRQKGIFALDLIYRFYSHDGTSKDINITSDKIMDDGSERLTWVSKGGGYSGASYFETREGRTTFLMFTIEWLNEAESLYLDTLNEIVASYIIP